MLAIRWQWESPLIPEASLMRAIEYLFQKRSQPLFRATSFVLMGFAALVVLAGCNSEPKGPKLTPVKGTVTLDGQPMASGEVIFVSGGSASTAQVTNGAFTGEAPLGDNVVQIFSYREGAAAVEMGGEKFGGGKENFIPPQFNANSTMKANVEAGKANEFKFEVTSM